MMFGDPVRDFERHDAEQEEKERKLPKCCLCGSHIHFGEMAFHFKTWFVDKWVCDSCHDCLEEEIYDESSV